MIQIYLRSVNLPKSLIRRPRLSPRKRCIADPSLNQVILVGNTKGFIVFPHLSGVVLGRIVTLTFQFKSLVGGKTPQPQPPSLPRGCLAFDLGCIDVSTMDCEKSLRNCFVSFHDRKLSGWAQTALLILRHNVDIESCTWCTIGVRGLSLFRRSQV